jgi:hypothetical protein
MKNDIKLVVRNIIGEAIDGYVRVTVNSEVFNAVKGMRPTLAYRGQGDLGGNGVRVFSFEGVELCASYDKETRKTMFLMKEDDAKAHLLTLAQERDKAEKLPFNTAKFDRSVVATA